MTLRARSLFTWFKSAMLGHPDVSLDNRREHPRLRLRVPVVVKLGERELAGELLDVSASGMRVALQIAPPAGATVRVSAAPGSPLVGRQRLQCSVAWVRIQRPGYEVGLTFLAAPEDLTHSWIQPILRHIDRRRTQRRQRRIHAQMYVRLLGNVEGEGQCLNLSMGGCLLQVKQPLSPGQIVRLGLGPGRESSVIVNGRVLCQLPSGQRQLYRVQFLRGGFEQRNLSRLRSLIQSLIQFEELAIKDEPELDLESLTQHWNPSTAPPEPLVVRNPAPLPVPPVASPAPTPPLWLRVAPAPRLRPRRAVLRSPSLWAARALPVAA